MRKCLWCGKEMEGNTFCSGCESDFEAIGMKTELAEEAVRLNRTSELMLSW